VNAARYRVQVSDRAGIYVNPFRRGGEGVKWSPWYTVVITASKTMATAEYYRVLPEMFRRVRVMLRNVEVMPASQWENRPKRLRKRRS
jgi:hypothetical protein